MLALVLACSLFVGVTGAYFTDTIGSDSALTKNFGIVKLDATTPVALNVARGSGSDATEALMPGDTLSIAGVVTNVGDNAWVSMTLTIVFDEDAGDIAVPDASWTWTSATHTMSKATTPEVVAHNGTKSLAASFTMPTTIGNSAAQSVVSFTWSVGAVQAANITTAEAAATQIESAVHQTQTIA